VYVPKFRSRRTSAQRGSQRKSALDEVVEEGSERQASAEPEDHRDLSKRTSAPVRMTPDKDDVTKSPDESVGLLSDEPLSSPSFELEGDTPARSLSQKGRGMLQRQDESIV